MGHSSRNMENGSVEDDLNCRDLLAQEVSENFSMLPRDCSCDVLMKNMPAFCPCV